jgi:hypothetical protein
MHASGDSGARLFVAESLDKAVNKAGHAFLQSISSPLQQIGPSPAARSAITAPNDMDCLLPIRLGTAVICNGKAAFRSHAEPAEPGAKHLFNTERKPYLYVGRA